MKIVIVSAMEKEKELIVPMITDAVGEKIKGVNVIRGRINNNDVILMQCGIGKVNSAINTYKIISEFEPDLLINSGVAGGASSSVKRGDILVADYVAYHDVWCGPGTETGAADGLDVFMECDRKVIELSHKILDGKRLQVGLICSGDKFITNKEEILEIQSEFPEVLAVDMESASIAQTCIMENVKFNIIRIISDTPGSGDNVEEYQNFWKEAPEKTFKLIESLLTNL